MPNILEILKNHIKDLILFGLVVMAFLLIGFNFYRDIPKKENNTMALLDKEVDEEPEVNPTFSYKVDIKGAIKTPGVYEVKEGSIINDVVTLAGGFNSNAYQNGINLSKKVSDEMVIYIYTKNEIKAAAEAKKVTEQELNSGVCEVPSYDICNCVDENKSVIETNPNVTESPSNEESSNNSSNNKELVNINTATKEQLMSVSGIGESKALAIISYRTENGLFKSINDLLNVSGIGDSLFAKIKEFITV